MKEQKPFMLLIVAVGMLTVALASGAWALDSDNDGVEDAIDFCPDTVIPEDVPKIFLGFHRFALTDDDTTFNRGKKGESSITLADTAGCSCEQIIDISGLGKFNRKFGCSKDVMRTFIAAVDGGVCAVFPGDGAGNGPELSYTDNGDGTVTDNNTGYMWEVKLPAADVGGNCADGDQANRSVHCVNNLYTWIGGSPYEVFLETLNNKCDGDESIDCTAGGDADCGADGPCGHAGFRDWEIPHVKLLQSIVDYSGSYPTIDPTFGPTAGSFYWSLTSYAFYPRGAWNVDFGNGSVNFGHKSDLLRVRAVRGGG